MARFGEIGAWDVRPVTSLRDLFEDQKDFNEDISRWDTSNVTDMHGTFYEAYSFNQPLERWNTAKVTDMRYMFSGAPCQRPSWCRGYYVGTSFRG